MLLLTGLPRQQELLLCKRHEVTVKDQLGHVVVSFTQCFGAFIHGNDLSDHVRASTSLTRCLAFFGAPLDRGQRHPVGNLLCDKCFGLLLASWQSACFVQSLVNAWQWHIQLEVLVQ
jgi:hypothetical protein